MIANINAFPVGDSDICRVGRLARRLVAVPLLAASTSLSCTKPMDPSPTTATTQGARKVDVGGYSLTLLTRGEGTPTVVIDPGLGEPAVESGAWTTVFDAVSKTTRTCLYDRAGLGSSDAAPIRPRTSRDMARDLHTLLANAKIPGPYLLVGHSIGGLNVRVFAAEYPNEVAGMVLVDATHPDQELRWLGAMPAEKPGEPEGLKKGRDYLNSRLAKPGANPEGMDVVASGAQVRVAPPLRDKPLAVLSHSPGWKMAPDLPEEVSRDLERVSQELQAGLPGLSSDSTHKVAQKAGHAIHAEDPQLVIDAILEVVGKVRARVTK